jgi:hypothetical protein
MQQSPKDLYPAIPDPWDDPDDHIDRLFWLDAIENGELRLLARYCRESIIIDRRVLSALADRLDPQGVGSYYEWKKANGRPTAQAKPPSIASVVDHLRNAAAIDPGVLSWLADQFDPTSPCDSHFVFKQTRKRGRPLRRSRFLSEEMGVILLGLRIEQTRKEFERLRSGYGKLEGALQHFVDGQDKRYKAMTRSRARRAYEFYKKKIAKTDAG